MLAMRCLGLESRCLGLSLETMLTLLIKIISTDVLQTDRQALPYPLCLIYTLGSYQLQKFKVLDIFDGVDG